MNDSLKKFVKKDIFVVVVIQILSTLAIIGYLNMENQKPKQTANTDSSTAAVNALSARLGQVQVDLNQIKAKLGAGQPAIQNQKKQ